MTINILFSASSEGWDMYRTALTKALDKIRHLKKELTELKIKRLCQR